MLIYACLYSQTQLKHILKSYDLYILNLNKVKYI